MKLPPNRFKEKVSPESRDYLVTFEDGSTKEVEASSEEEACGMAIAERVFAKPDRDYRKNAKNFADTKIVSVQGGDLV